jgi:CRISPR-associated protein Cas2
VEVSVHVLISYDVAVTSEGGQRRLRRVAKVCENHGQRVQNSVFECLLDNARLVQLRKELLNIMDEKQDSVRIYKLGREWNERAEHYGVKPSFDPSGPLIV